MVEEIAPWSGVWAWGVPLIILNVIIHASGLLAIHETITPALSRHAARSRFAVQVAIYLGIAVLAVTLLHACEGVVWALCYLMLGAFADKRSAMLFSIEAMTTYGHSAVALPPHWRMMGALEALNGMILFGLTTAYLYAVLQSAAIFRSR